MTSKTDDFSQTYPAARAPDVVWTGRLPKTQWSRPGQTVREEIAVDANDGRVIKALDCLNFRKPFDIHSSTLLLTTVRWSQGVLAVEGIDYDEAVAMYDWPADQ